LTIVVPIATIGENNANLRDYRSKFGARRRSAQYRWLKTTVTVTGIVHSVKEVASSYPARWIVTVVDKRRIAA
jgi:hypothetical protein